MQVFMSSYGTDNGKVSQSQTTVIINNNQPAKMTTVKKPFKNLEGKLKVWTGAKNSINLASKSEKLSELRKNCTVKRVDVQLLQPLLCGKFILKSIDRIIKNGLFIDWLLLKCEAANISFINVHEQININSTHDIESLKTLINQESCLPLPFIYKDDKNPVYFFLSFNSHLNCKSEKLNTRVFFDAGKKILVSLDLGIRLNEGYEKRIEHFKIHVSGLLEPYVKQHLTEIKRLIVYNHILWGFLQDWVRDLSSNVCKNTFSTKQVAENLTLYRIDNTKLKQLAEMSHVFLVASFPEFALYLKFTPNVSGNFFVFMIENIETQFTCTNFVIQYYKQFFYINDESKTNALKCLLDYSQGRKNFLDLENVCEYQKSEDKLPVEKPLLKAKTVEEINASVGEVNKEQPNEESIMKLLKSGGIDKEKIKNKLLPFVKESLKQCFERDPIEIVNKDESNDASLMVHRFQDAVSRADRSGTFQMFLEYVYNSLQMHFTNATCQIIMECLIYKELENRYNNPNGLVEESVGEKELEKLVSDKNSEEAEPALGNDDVQEEREDLVRDNGVEKEPELVASDKEANVGVKRKGEAVEEDPSPKMPKLMPLWEYLKKEREKDLVSKYSSCELKTCSVMLSRENRAQLDKKAEEYRLAKNKSSSEGNKENNLYEKSAKEKNLAEMSSPRVPQEKNLSESVSSPKSAEKTNLKECGKSPRATPEEPISDENRNNTGNTNFMLKFPRIFLKTKSRKTSKCESDKSDTTHESDEEPQRKSQDFWEKEKLYRECLTSKAVVVINKIEDVVGIPNIRNKTVKITKDDTLKIKPEPSSPKHFSECAAELGMKVEPQEETRNTSIQVDASEENKLPVENDKVEEPMEVDKVDKPQEVVTTDVVSSPPDDDLEILEVIQTAKSKKSCQKCLQEFDSYKEVEEHEKLNHANDKIFSCHSCSKRFHAYHYLELHIKTKHDKNLHCTYCNVTSKNVNDLENHLESEEHNKKRLSYVEEL